MKEFKDAISENRLTLVDFYASWCGPCKAMHPVIDTIEKEFESMMNVLRLDIDAQQNHELVHQYRISSVPTIIFFRSGEVVWRGSGAVSADYLRGVIERLSQKQEV
ncbi:MAG: thioredoxin family protein [Alistipes putredinis]|nr:MAG: thioredoxin family protein [Alistipes putredinis]